MAVAAAAKTDMEWQDDAFTRQHIMDRLAHYRELRAQGGGTSPLTAEDINRSLNTWLGELAALAEIRWVPTTDKEKALMAFKWTKEALDGLA